MRLKITEETPVLVVQEMMCGASAAEAVALRHHVVSRELDTSAMSEREWDALLGFALGYVCGMVDAYRLATRDAA